MVAGLDSPGQFVGEVTRNLDSMHPMGEPGAGTLTYTIENFCIILSGTGVEPQLQPQLPPKEPPMPYYRSLYTLTLVTTLALAGCSTKTSAAAVTTDPNALTVTAYDGTKEVRRWVNVKRAEPTRPGTVELMDSAGRGVLIQGGIVIIENFR